MYALARNSWKFKQRDKRVHKAQNIEFEAFAPDTIEEIINARFLLEKWTAKTSLAAKNDSADGKDNDKLSIIGRDLLNGEKEQTASLEVLGENLEKSRRKAVIIKFREGYHAYTDMLYYYSIKNIIDYMNSNKDATFSLMCDALNGESPREWVNLGGQLVPTQDVVCLRSDICSGELDTWDKIHNRYDTLWNAYNLEKQKHAFSTLCDLLETDRPTEEQWLSTLERAITIQEFIREQVYISRKKDYENHFRQATYNNKEEMKATIGTAEDNSFVKQVQIETENFKLTIHEIKKRK